MRIYQRLRYICLDSIMPLPTPDYIGAGGRQVLQKFPDINKYRKSIIFVLGMIFKTKKQNFLNPLNLCANLLQA